MVKVCVTPSYAFSVAGKVFSPSSNKKRSKINLTMIGEEEIIDQYNSTTPSDYQL